MANNQQQNKHLTPFLVWLITLLLFELGGHTEQLPLPAQALILAVIAVPLVYYIVLPFYFHVINRIQKQIK